MVTAMLLIIFVVLDAMWVGYLWSMPVPEHREAFFGVRVGPGHPDSRARRILLTYRLALAALFACIELTAVVISVHRADVLALIEVRIVTYAALITAGLADYILCARMMRPVRAPEPIRVASSLRARHLGDYTNLGFEALVIGATVIPLVLIAAFYRSIPDVLPTADAAQWEPRSFRLAFGPSLFALYLQGLVFILKLGMVRATLALPAEHADEHLRLKEESIRTSARIWDMFRGLIAATAILNLRLLTRTPDQVRLLAGIGSVFGLVIAAIGFAGLVRMMSRLSSLYRDLKSSTGEVYVARPTDLAHWHAGGLVYFNRDDPAVLVETAVGSKYTTGYVLNLGDPWSYGIIVYFAALPAVFGWFLGVL
jgi:uncharacterized membrane protein